MTVDVKKTLDCYRARVGDFRLVDVPPLRYLMIDGRGDPNTSNDYRDALAALYPVAYAAKRAGQVPRSGVSLCSFVWVG